MAIDDASHLLSETTASFNVLFTSVRRGRLVVRRGKADLDPAGFDIAQCYGSLGLSVLREP